MSGWGWTCDCGHWLDESDGEPVYTSMNAGSKQCCSQSCADALEGNYQAEYDARPCHAVDGKLHTMGDSGRCDLVDETTHRAKCRTCGKKGWYSERGRLSEKQGVDIWNVVFAIPGTKF